MPLTSLILKVLLLSSAVSSYEKCCSCSVLNKNILMNNNHNDNHCRTNCCVLKTILDHSIVCVCYENINEGCLPYQPQLCRPMQTYLPVPRTTPPPQNYADDKQQIYVVTSITNPPVNSNRPPQYSSPTSNTQINGFEIITGYENHRTPQYSPSQFSYSAANYSQYSAFSSAGWSSYSSGGFKQSDSNGFYGTAGPLPQVILYIFLNSTKSTYIN